MRAWSLALVILLAGCVQDSPVAETEAPVVEPVAPPLPDDIHEEGTMVASAVAACVDCFHDYPFKVEADARMAATLTWDNPSDLDLYVYQGDEIIDGSVAFGPEHEALDVALGPGAYGLVIHNYAGAAVAYTLEATFS